MIAVGEAEQTPEDPELRAREQAILDANRDAWLGALAKLPPKDFTAKWRWGFVDAVCIGPTTGHRTSDLDFPNTIGDVMKLPQIDFLRELVLGARSYNDYPTSWNGCIEKLAETGVPASLRRLEVTRGEFWDISSTELGDLTPLYPHLGKLEELRIEMGAMSS